MKNKGKRRILALVLCMVVMLSNSSFIFASGETETAAAAPETTAVTPEPEVSAASELAELPTPEPTAEPTEAPTPEPTAEPTPEASAAPEPTEVPTPEVSAAPEPTAEPTPEASAVPEPTEVPTPEVSAAPEPTEIPTSEPTPEASASPTPAAEQDIGSEESAAVTPTPEAEPEPDGSSEEIVLEGSCGDTTVILSGPASSFPEGTELSILVQEPAEEDQEVIEEAVEKQAEEQEMEVKSYTALDIRLLSNGEEIQPLGPVSVKFQQPEQQERTAEETSTQVLHVDESTGNATDMEAEVAEDGEVAIETTHFSIYVVVDLDQLGGEIELKVQHWATVNRLDGVDGTDGLIESAAPDGIPGNATAALRSKDVFTNIYTDDIIKLDNKLNKNVEELSKVLLADANSEIKNYELKEIWVLEDNQTPGTSTIDKTDTDAYNTEKNKWTVYSLDDTDKTVKLTKKSIIRMIYEPVKASNALSQNVTFYDYDVTDGKRYNANGQEDPNGNYLNTTNKGINSESNYNGGNEYNRLAVGMNSTWVDHKYHNAKSNNGNGVMLNWADTGKADVAKEGIVTGISADGPLYNGVVAPQLFNDTPQVGKTVINGYQLHFSQVGDTYTLSSVTNESGDTVLSDLETIREIWDKSGENRHIFSNNFWPLDDERHDNQDPLLGGSTSFNSFNTNKVTQNEGNSKSTGESDDGKDHNWLFGMRYSFEFTLGDYTGPLNFYFRGDDDFWLFVDGVLRTDLGGIHSSVGANLDLTNCINTSDRDKTHKIEIIYAERGCFGSTCYMQFTLPNVKPVEFDTETPKTSVTVNKVWNDHNNPNRPASIDVELYYRVKGTNDWTKYDTKTLNATNNWTYTWTNMPKESYEYRVHEVGEKNGKFGNYRTEYSCPDGVLDQNKEDGTFSGTITNSASPSTYITVTKVWNDGENANNSRPDSVDFYLYYRKVGDTKWTQYPNGKLTLTAAKNWTGKYENLPVYWGNTNTDEKMEYTVMEINGNAPLSNGGELPGTTGYKYTVSYPEGYIENDFGKGYEAKTDNSETPKETLNLTVTNSLGVSIEVNKVWKGHDPENGTVIYAGLYQAGKLVKDKWVELKADNNWTETFQYLTPAKDYSVKELRQVESGETAEFTIKGVGYVGVNSGQETTVGNIKYDVSYEALTQDTSDMSLSTVTITNQAKWQLIKYSSSSQDKEIVLQGAKFELKDTKGAVYTGESDDNGIVKWKKGNQDFTGVFPNGTYTLTETAAPTGYMLGASVTFEMEGGVPVNMSGESADIKNGILTFYYANEILYTLPSTGGAGIHWYIIGGMLLMMAAVLMVYKQKRGEVLERK